MIESALKRLSDNDVGLTNSHQAGFLIPKLFVKEGLFEKMSDEELNYAAGIIPYVIDCEQEISFLLGYENNKWSGFVGKYENCDNLNIINTAVREFNEETAYTFNDYIDILHTI
jgi:hypothetical protein